MKYFDLELAFESGSMGQFGEVRAYINKHTHELVYDDEEYTGEPCPVEDIESDDNYIPVPTQNDLDLGHHLVSDFVEKEIPGLRYQVDEMFRKKGAYQRYKQFLHQLRLLDKWYEYETARKEEALRNWCKENQIKLSD